MSGKDNPEKFSNVFDEWSLILLFTSRPESSEAKELSGINSRDETQSTKRLQSFTNQRGKHSKRFATPHTPFPVTPSMTSSSGKRCQAVPGTLLPWFLPSAWAVRSITGNFWVFSLIFWSRVFREVKFLGSWIFREVKFSGKSNFREVKFPGSQISREFKFSRKLNFPGSQISR